MMNDFIQAGELRDEAKRLLRYRFPLILAILVNFVFLIRVPLHRMWAEAAPPPTHTTALTVAQPTAGPQMPLRYSRVQAVSQDIEVTPSKSADPSPTAAPAEPAAPPSPPSTGVSPLAFTRVWGAAGQWLITRCAALRGQTDPTATSEQAAAPVSPPDTFVPPPPTASRTDASPPAHGDNPPVVAASPPTGLTIRNVLENAGPVSFLVNGRVCELQPGEAHEFAAGTSWTVQFHRGESFGNAEQTLAPGVYCFVVTGQGWDLTVNR